MLNIAVRAARAAGNVIARHFDRRDELTIDRKGRHDYVTEVDRQAEQEIIKVLRRTYPDHAILAEESGEDGGAHGNKRGVPDFQWVIDPLDGTTNFLHGFPQFAVSIALLHRGRLEQAVVYDPIAQDLFTASRGDGAQLNSKRIRVSTAKGLENALLATGLPYNDYTHLDAYLGMLKELIVQTAGIRRPGSAALDLAYVAAGRVDGFWEIGLNSWDLAAGALLVQEAGGFVGDLTGGEGFIQSGNIVAASPKVYEALLKVIEPHLTPLLRK
ncbi:inositol-phosphate phosphatase [Endothiovibrio diazotrophicus]